nr:reverse transcriptase domain-containing protein [Tanacetum cinerariifolium]
MVHPSQGDKGYVRPAWTGVPEKARNRGGPREARRNMGVYTPYLQKDTFTPLIKTLKEILAMETVASEKLAHLVKDIYRNNQQNGNQGKNDVKVINMIRDEGSRKRPFEERSSGLMNELTFLAIPQSTCKETQWRQREEQMSRIREQVILRTQNNYGRGPNLGPVSPKKHGTKKTRRRDMYPFLEEGEELASLMGYTYKCFLRLSKEYSQIRMAEDVEEKTGFHMKEGVYCFTHMPKELKNSAAML